MPRDTCLLHLTLARVSTLLAGVSTFPFRCEFVGPPLTTVQGRPYGDGMTTNRYMVITANGCVGRRTLWSELTDNMARCAASTWSTQQEAQYIADQFNGAVTVK